MTKEIEPGKLTRDMVVEGLREFSSFGFSDPDELSSLDNSKVAQAEHAFIDWATDERATAEAIGTIEARIAASFAISTVYVDAGFTDPEFLAEVANEWLGEYEDEARNTELIALTEQIHLKREQINRTLGLATF
jgi:hypothetical protein